MADELDKTNDESPASPKKGGKGKLLVILATPVLIAGAGVAGAVFGPRFFGSAGDIHAETPQAKNSAAAVSPVPKGITVQFKPVVVDVRDADGAVHHIKVTLAAELPEAVAEEEFKRLQPRGREAIIAYLRKQDFADVTDPNRFDQTRKQLADRVIAAIGKSMLDRVLIVDFVAQ